MSSLVVGGTAIRVEPSGANTDRSDGADRSPLFDNSLLVSVAGGSREDFHFTTPPVSPANFDSYMGVLAKPQAQMCSGDILSIPKMCFAEVHGWTPVESQGTRLAKISFTLHEAQSAKVLLKYSPGDTITGESFTRSTTAYQLNASGVLVSAAINAKRDAHHLTLAGTITRLSLLEDARTNDMLQANAFNNAAWTKVTMTVGTGIADPAGGTTACTLTATAGGAQIYQNLGAGSSAVRTNSIWMRRRTGTGTVTLYNPLDTGGLVCALTSSWQRFSNTGTASTSRLIDVVITTNGDAVDVWCGQQEIGAFASSEIPTTTVAVTRGASAYSLPHTIPPGESTFYIKFVEGGTAYTGGSTGLCVVGASATTSLFIYAAGVYAIVHRQPGSTDRTSTLAVAPAIGQVTEIRGLLFGDGSVQIGQSIAGAAETMGTQSPAMAFAPAWDTLTVLLNSRATGDAGFNAFQSFKIVAGARSLSEMRAL